MRHLLMRRRPSPAMGVAVTALFVSLGGVGYAAIQLPNGSVGSAQIRSGAVTFRKIAPGAVGIARINPNTVQARVLQNCGTGNSAITAIDIHGRPACKATRPAEFDVSTSAPVALTSSTTAATVTSEALSGGSSYLVIASPYVQVRGTAGQHVEVDCTLAAGPSTGAVQKRSITVDVGSTNPDETGSIPLVVTAPPNATSITTSVACARSYAGGSSAPAVAVSTTINALETSSNTTAQPPYSIVPSSKR